MSRKSPRLYIATALLLPLLAGCGDGKVPALYASAPTTPTTGPAATPTFMPPGGAFTAAQSVSIADTTPGALIYYTTDGSTPSSSSTLYTGSIAVASTKTLLAIATASGYSNSAVASATYTITIGTPPLTSAATPTFTPPGGTFTAAQSVTIADTTPGAAIYYTIDGTTPSSSSMLYTGAIAVASTKTLSAIATASGFANSAVASATYTFTTNTSTHEWTWIGGSSQAFAPGVYGTQGVGAAGDQPGQRIEASSWTDSSGNMWLFGGEFGFSSSPAVYGFLNDLWEYSPATGIWTWQSGSSSFNAQGTYGTQGVSSSSNTPGGRRAATTWTDSSGRFWLFGGLGYGNSTILGSLSDLWMFDPATRIWTWMGGSQVHDTVGVYGSLGTPSSTTLPGGRSESVGWADSSGNLWLFGGFGIPATLTQGALNDLWKYSISSGQWTWVNGTDFVGDLGVYGTQGVAASQNRPAATLQGAVGWVDTTGNFWLFGGFGFSATAPATTEAIRNCLWRYQPATGQWAWMSGTNGIDAIGVYGNQGMAAATNAPGAREDSVSWKDASGRMWLFGGAGEDSVGNLDLLDDLWQFDPATNQWTWITGSSTIDQVPSYGVLGVASTTNTPGARYFPTGWTDASGALWLFGGEGFVSTSAYPDLSDLWRYQP